MKNTKIIVKTKNKAYPIYIGNKIISTTNLLIKKNLPNVRKICIVCDRNVPLTLLKKLTKSLKDNNCVIALGGGAFINKTVRESVLKNSISVWLNVDIETLNKRIKWNKKRPLLSEKNNQKKISQLYSERKNIYKLANHRINCDNLIKKDIAKKIITFYEKY